VNFKMIVTSVANSNTAVQTDTTWKCSDGRGRRTNRRENSDETACERNRREIRLEHRGRQELRTAERDRSERRIS